MQHIYARHVAAKYICIVRIARAVFSRDADDGKGVEAISAHAGATMIYFQKKRLRAAEGEVCSTTSNLKIELAIVVREHLQLLTVGGAARREAII